MRLQPDRTRALNNHSVGIAKECVLLVRPNESCAKVRNYIAKKLSRIYMARIGAEGAPVDSLPLGKRGTISKSIYRALL